MQTNLEKKLLFQKNIIVRLIVGHPIEIFIRTWIVILNISDKAAFNKTKCFEKVHLGGNYQIYQ